MSRLQRVMRGWAFLDLVVTGMLALPVVSSAFIALLYGLEGAVFGPREAPPFAPVQLFFVNLAGVLGVLWALARIFEGTRFLALCDTAGRCVVAAWIGLALVAEPGAPRILLLFVATELLGAVHQAIAIRGDSGLG